jgi:hypothetical protein
MTMAEFMRHVIARRKGTANRPTYICDEISRTRVSLSTTGNHSKLRLYETALLAEVATRIRNFHTMAGYLRAFGYISDLMDVEERFKKVEEARQVLLTELLAFAEEWDKAYRRSKN